jgi:hypothetical protein
MVRQGSYKWWRFKKGVLFITICFPCLKEGCDYDIILIHYPEFFKHSDLINYLGVMEGDLFAVVGGRVLLAKQRHVTESERRQL